MSEDSKEVIWRRATLAALSAVAAMGGNFYDDNAIGFGPQGLNDLSEHVRDWADEIHNAVIADRETAIKVGAYFIFYEEHANRAQVWKLCSFRVGSSGGHDYSGEAFPDGETFWSAMRTVEALAQQLNVKPTKKKKAQKTKKVAKV